MSRIQRYWWIESPDGRPVAGPFDHEHEAVMSARQLNRDWMLVVTGDHYGAPLWPLRTFDSLADVPEEFWHRQRAGTAIVEALPGGFAAVYVFRDADAARGQEPPAVASRPGGTVTPAPPPARALPRPKRGATLG